MWWRLVAETGSDGNASDLEANDVLKAEEADFGSGDPARDEEVGESSSEKSPSEEALSSKPFGFVARADG